MTVSYDLAPAVQRLLGDHHPTGISTGFLESIRGDWPRLVEEAESFSMFAAELSALSQDELAPLVRHIERQSVLPFQYLSVHGPSKGLDGDERKLVDALELLVPFVDSIVMHPDSIRYPHEYRRLGRTLVIENMDRRKEWGRSASELDDLFQALPEAGFCFDVAHAWSVDRSMEIANELLASFASRLRHVHLSSLSDADRHIPLRNEDAELFSASLLRCVDVPWILEAPIK